MKRVSQCLLVALCSLSFALTVYSDDSDFIDEKGKALRHLKVVPGTKRNNIDFHTVEQEAGRAVLKLLDAKIGKKVNDAAKEVTDFLNDAVGHHANQRAANIQSDKQKEMSLLHLGAKKVLTNQDEESKPKKNKDGSFLVNFKIPYIVTPVNEKKKPKAKKFHHKHAKKPYWKKYHHRILHHKHHHHHHHHHPHVSDVSKPPASSPPAPYNTQAQAPQAQSPPSPPPSYNAIDLSFNGYNWTYNYSNDTSQDMTPCQGNCMDPCTQQCSMSQDCCCCDPNLMAQTQMAAAPLQAAPAVPAYQQVVPVAQPEYQPPPMPAVQPEQCPMGCKRNCFTYCPRDCCGVAGKRDKVLGSGNREDTGDQMESGHKGEGSGNESVADEETEQSQVEESDKQQTGSEKQDDSTKSEEETTDSTQEGSTREQNDDAELDD